MIPKSARSSKRVQPSTDMQDCIGDGSPEWEATAAQIRVRAEPTHFNPAELEWGMRVARREGPRLFIDDARWDGRMNLATLNIHQESAVRFAEISAPPMNLLGPELVRDLVSFIKAVEADDSCQVMVFKSADPDYFISHVDVNRVKEYREEAAKLTGEASIAALFRHLSASRVVSIAQIEGRVRGAGSEFVLACDMRFAARESAVFCQIEPAFGQIPGGGAAQHLTRLMGRSRALEVLLSAEDYDADLAERYGWINRAMPARDLGDFVSALAHRIGGFPSGGHVVVKQRVNAIALPPAEDFRRDSELFAEELNDTEVQTRLHAAMERGFQTRDGELSLGRMLGELPAKSPDR